MPLRMAAEYCGVGTATLTSQGPQSIRIGQKRKVWLREALDKWLDGLAEKLPVSAEIGEWDD